MPTLSHSVLLRSVNSRSSAVVGILSIYSNQYVKPCVRFGFFLYRFTWLVAVTLDIGISHIIIMESSPPSLRMLKLIRVTLFRLTLFHLVLNVLFRLHSWYSTSVSHCGKSMYWRSYLISRYTCSSASSSFICLYIYVTFGWVDFALHMNVVFPEYDLVDFVIIRCESTSFSLVLFHTSLPLTRILFVHSTSIISFTSMHTFVMSRYLLIWFSLFSSIHIVAVKAIIMIYDMFHISSSPIHDFI